MRNATVIISSESRILMMLANHHASPFGKRTCKSRPKLGMESCPLLALKEVGHRGGTGQAKLGMESCPLLARVYDPVCAALKLQAWHGIVPPVGTTAPHPCWMPRPAKLGMESCPLLALVSTIACIPALGDQAWHGIVPPVGTLSRCHAIAGDNPSLAWNRAPCWHKDRCGSYLGWRPKLGMESCPLLALQAPVCVNPVA